MLNYFLLLVIFTKSAVIHGLNENRVLNGEITPPDMFQFAVKFLAPGSLCTASVVSKRHVLTAAHCIDFDASIKVEHDRYREFHGVPYFSGIHPQSDQNVDFSKLPNATTVYIPVTRKPPFGANTDIAVVEYPEGTDLGGVPVKLAKDYFEKEGDEAYILGYGGWWLDGNKSSGGSDVLRHVKITMINNCIGGLQICGGNATHRSYFGDSGGPMVISRNNEWYQIGVSAGTGSYDGRCRVSSYCNFIEEVTKNEVKCESIFPEQNNIPVLPLKMFPQIYKGQSTPSQVFNFVVPLYNYYYNQGCTATVISKRHLLTSAFCVYRDWWAESKALQLTKYSSFKTFTGKLFPDFRSKKMVQSNFKNDVINVTVYFPAEYIWPWDYNIAVIEFPVGTNFGIEPITLAKNYIQVYLENEAIVAGYALGDIKQNVHMEESPPNLLHSNAILSYDSATDLGVNLENNESLKKDEGGPTLIEKNGKFYQIGVNIGSGTPNGSRTYLSNCCEFIEEVTKNEVKCESVAPIYEQPTTTQNFLPQKQESITSNPQSLNNASAIGFKMIIAVLILFCL